MILRSLSLPVAALAALGLVATLASAPAQAGQEGHGGDPLAAEFVAKGWQLYEHLAMHNDLAPDLTFTDLEHLKSVLKTTRIEPVDYDLYDEYGASVQARVLPDPLIAPKPSHQTPLVIQVNRPGLYEFLRNGQDLSRLVLHEYLWIIGKDDANYKISSRLGQTVVDPLPGDLKSDICRD